MSAIVIQVLGGQNSVGTEVWKRYKELSERRKDYLSQTLGCEVVLVKSGCRLGCGNRYAAISPPTSPDG